MNLRLRWSELMGAGLAVALPARRRERHQAGSERQPARGSGPADEPSGPGRLLPNGLQTAG